MDQVPVRPTASWEQSVAPSPEIFPATATRSSPHIIAEEIAFGRREMARAQREKQEWEQWTRSWGPVVVGLGGAVLLFMMVKSGAAKGAAGGVARHLLEGRHRGVGDAA